MLEKSFGDVLNGWRDPTRFFLDCDKGLDQRKDADASFPDADAVLVLLNA